MFHSYLKPAGQSIRLGRYEKRRYKKYNSELEKRVARFQSPQAMTDVNQKDENQTEDGEPKQPANARRRVNDQENCAVLRKGGPDVDLRYVSNRTVLPWKKSARLDDACFRRMQARFRRM
jgi:hypothetical protein